MDDDKKKLLIVSSVAILAVVGAIFGMQKSAVVGEKEVVVGTLEEYEAKSKAAIEKAQRDAGMSVSSSPDEPAPDAINNR